MLILFYYSLSFVIMENVVKMQQQSTSMVCVKYENLCSLHFFIENKFAVSVSQSVQSVVSYLSAKIINSSKLACTVATAQKVIESPIEMTSDQTRNTT